MSDKDKAPSHGKKKKKGWFRRYLERLAKENERFGGKVCPS